MKLRHAMSLFVAPLALAGCMQPDRPADRPVTQPAVRLTGVPQSCIPLSQIRETRVRDDYTIDFIQSGGRAWRNTLPNRCSGLKSRDGFIYETSLSQLCSTDIIYVLENYGGTPQRGVGCGLGTFQPVNLEK